jgi:hypothetical protein
MKALLVNQALKAAKEMSAREFANAFENQIEILDADNICNENEGDFNIIFHAKDGQASISFYGGRLEQSYQM